jgi:hypothetical protein
MTVSMLEVRYQVGDDKGAFMTSQRILESVLIWDPQHESLNSHSWYWMLPICKEIWFISSNIPPMPMRFSKRKGKEKNQLYDKNEAQV